MNWRRGREPEGSVALYPRQVFVGIKLFLRVKWAFSTYKKSLCQPNSRLILKIVCYPAFLGIGSCALFLQPFCPSIEDLESSCSGGDCIKATRGSSSSNEVVAAARGQPRKAASSPAHECGRAHTHGHDMLIRCLNPEREEWIVCMQLSRSWT